MYWILLDTEKDVAFNFYVSVGNELAPCGVSSTDELCVHCEGGGSSGERRQREMSVS
jgi:hypothetical protein